MLESGTRVMKLVWFWAPDALCLLYRAEWSGRLSSSTGADLELPCWVPHLLPSIICCVVLIVMQAVGAMASSVKRGPGVYLSHRVAVKKEETHKALSIVLSTWEHSLHHLLLSKEISSGFRKLTRVE